MHLNNLKPAKNTTLMVPEIMNDILPANMVEGKSKPGSKPLFTEEVNVGIFQSTLQNCIEAKTAKATDMAFNILRQESDTLTSWTAFNKERSKVDPDITTVGYMPIIQQPAH